MPIAGPPDSGKVTLGNNRVMIDDNRFTVLVGGPRAEERWVALVERVARLALVRLAQRGDAPPRAEVSVLLVDDEAIAALNRQYRSVDAPTDVLSFSQLEGVGPAERDLPEDFQTPLGDIVISIPRMRMQALEYGHSEARELAYLLVHGVLHLIGYDHEVAEDAARMRAAEEDVLGAAGLARDYGAG
jgi:probable rRNA maturation factor